MCGHSRSPPVAAPATPCSAYSRWYSARWSRSPNRAITTPAAPLGRNRRDESRAGDTAQQLLQRSRQREHARLDRASADRLVEIERGVEPRDRRVIALPQCLEAARAAQRGLRDVAPTDPYSGRPDRSRPFGTDE